MSRRGNTPELAMSGDQRAESGAIVSFENPLGKRLTLHRVGPVREAVRQACEIAMAQDESFLVVAVSTPNSIYGDLAGRLPVKHGDSPPRYLYPELPVVAAAGFDAIIHPRLLGQSAQSDRKIRKGGKPRQARP